MKRLMIFVILIVLFSLIVLAQKPFRVITTDFRISTDSVSSTFKQRDIRLFPKPNRGFTAAWVDERDGEPSYYAQDFDGNGNKVGQNYKTFSNESISFLKDGSSMSFHHTIGQWYEYAYINIQGDFNDSNNEAITTVELVDRLLPYCWDWESCDMVKYCAATSTSRYYFLSDLSKINK